MVALATHQHKSATGAHVVPRILNPPSTSLLIPLVCPRVPASSALLHASNLHWSSVLHMVIYMFQCYSLISSHPCLLAHCPIVCSLYLCLFCCPAFRIIITIFPNSIHTHKYTISVYLFLTYFTLYNRLQFHPLHYN